MHSAKKTIKISLIIPLYNEERRVHNLNTLWMYIKNKKYIREIIVVNDGSTDKTLSFVRAFKKKTKCKIVSYRKNRGKGYAIKKGVMIARGTHVVFMDVDLSTPPQMLGVLKKAIQTSDIIVGTRKNKKAVLIQRQSKVRETMGAFFTFLSQKMMGVGVSDFTCGFKCFSRKAAKKIFLKQHINRWTFDAELLFLAKKYGFSIFELPVEWRDVKGTRVRFPWDAIQSFIDLLQIRFNDIVSRY